MKLKTNETYKINMNLDPLEQIDYNYFICIGEKEEYYIMNEISKYAELNGLYTNNIDFDEEFKDKQELDIKHYKRINNVESVYYKNEEFEYKLPERKTRKFVQI